MAAATGYLLCLAVVVVVVSVTATPLAAEGNERILPNEASTIRIPGRSFFKSKSRRTSRRGRRQEERNSEQESRGRRGEQVDEEKEEEMEMEMDGGEQVALLSASSNPRSAGRCCSPTIVALPADSSRLILFRPIGMRCDRDLHK